MHRSALWPSLFLLLGGLFLIRESSRPWAAEVDGLFHDWLMRQGSVPARRPALTLVEIDPTSSGSDKKAWPWRPIDYSLFLKSILPGRPGVVGIEPVLWWEENQPYMEVLENYLLRTPKLVLAAELDVVRSEESIPVNLPVLKNVKGNLAGLPEFAAVKRVPMPGFSERVYLGAVHFDPDADGLIRRVPMVMRYRGDAIPSFVLQTMMLWLQLVPDDIELIIGECVRLGSAMEVPIDAQGNLSINYHCLNAIQRVQFADLLLAVEEKAAGLEPGFDIEGLGRQIVLLGRTDKESRDLPLVNLRDGSRVEVLAASIATIQQRGFLKKITPEVQLCMVLFMTLIFVVAWNIPSFLVMCLSLILGAVYAMLATTLFDTQQLLMPAVLPYTLLLAIVLLRLFTGNKSKDGV